MTDIPFPLDRKHSCKNCIHMRGDCADEHLFLCGCNDQVITFVNKLDEGRFYRTWDICDDYQVDKPTCWNCGYFKACLIIKIIGDVETRKKQYICTKTDCVISNFESGCKDWQDDQDKIFRESRK